MSVEEAFGRAAHYDAHATVQRLVAKDLAERIALLPLVPAPRVLEIGCGTGLLGAALLDRLRYSRWLMTDIAPAMVERARQRFATGPEVQFATMDGERPDAPGPFDLVCSNLAAQWLRGLPDAVAKWRALLAPQGRLAFTTLAAGSFEEWRQAHCELSCGLHDYPSPRELVGLGLEVTVRTHVLGYTAAREFLGSVKAVGAGTPRRGHRPLTPAQLRDVMKKFEAGGAAATYVVATCVGGPLP